MKAGSVLIGVLTAIELIASAVYWWDGDWRHGAFWACASVMNICVTW